MVKIINVSEGSLCDKHGVKPGDSIITINNNPINDVLDYRFYICEEKLKISLINENNKKYTVKIKKDEYDDIGLSFETYLMDKQHSCANKCIFCFVDQLPKGLRESLYFKDDDERLSFFFGNYITLTNLSKTDVERIIKMHISPINVSVHTMNPTLRVSMMKNPKAGESLNILTKLANAGISINAQLVLCPGINDGKELEYSIKKLNELGDSLKSIAVVPVGLTKYRENLVKIEPYNKKTAEDVINTIESFGKEFKCYAADEFYLKAEKDIPPYEYYDEFSQLDNGVGMIRLFEHDFNEYLRLNKDEIALKQDKMNFSIATGSSSFRMFSECMEKLSKDIKVIKIDNDFFGHTVTVTGLITAGDLINQLKDKDLGDFLLISQNMLKREYPYDEFTNDHMFLDSVTLEEVSNTLNIKVIPMPNDVYEFMDKLLEVI